MIIKNLLLCLVQALLAKSEDTDCIIIESFTAMCEMIMLSATKLFSGFDVFKMVCRSSI